MEDRIFLVLPSTPAGVRLAYSQPTERLRRLFNIALKG